MAPPARLPTQLLTIEWPPKKPNVMTAMPPTMHASDSAVVSIRPASMTTNIIHSSLRRPRRPARCPMNVELNMPTR